MYSYPNGGMAPKVSLRSVASVIEPFNCQIPVCSEDTDIISVSEEESEAPVLMWVDNGAYCLSHSDQEIVLSGSLTRSFMQLRYCCYSFFPTWQDCNLLYCRRCLHSRSILGSLYRSYMSETTTGVLCPLLVVNWGCPCLRQLV